MNPEEGELRPQFVDRFGLCVSVTAPADEATRMEVVRRRIPFDAAPSAFMETWASTELALAECLRRARDDVASVEMPEALLALAVRICPGGRRRWTVARAPSKTTCTLRRCSRLGIADGRIHLTRRPRRIAALKRSSSNIAPWTQRRLLTTRSQPRVPRATPIAPQAPSPKTPKRRSAARRRPTGWWLPQHRLRCCAFTT